MILAWFIFILSAIIFAIVGWTGIFHAKKFRIPGDLTSLSVKLYVVAMLSVIIITVALVILNGADEPIVLPSLGGKINELMK